MATTVSLGSTDTTTVLMKQNFYSKQSFWLNNPNRTLQVLFMFREDPEASVSQPIRTGISHLKGLKDSWHKSISWWRKLQEFSLGVQDSESHPVLSLAGFYWKPIHGNAIQVSVGLMPQNARMKKGNLAQEVFSLTIIVAFIGTRPCALQLRISLYYNFLHNMQPSFLGGPGREVVQPLLPCCSR